MSELDGPDPVKELMLQDPTSKEAEYKDRVIMLEERMARAAVLVFLIVLPGNTSKEAANHTADMLLKECKLLSTMMEAYIKKYPKALKNL